MPRKPSPGSIVEALLHESYAVRGRKCLREVRRSVTIVRYLPDKLVEVDDQGERRTIHPVRINFQEPT